MLTLSGPLVFRSILTIITYSPESNAAVFLKKIDLKSACTLRFNKKLKQYSRR